MLAVDSLGPCVSSLGPLFFLFLANVAAGAARRGQHVSLNCQGKGPVGASVWLSPIIILKVDTYYSCLVHPVRSIYSAPTPRPRRDPVSFLPPSIRGIPRRRPSLVGHCPSCMLPVHASTHRATMNRHAYSNSGAYPLGGRSQFSIQPHKYAPCPVRPVSAIALMSLFPDSLLARNLP